jgi:glutathione S-transferase
MIKIYGSAMSSAGRCLWTLEEVGVPYERVDSNLRDPEGRKKFIAEVWDGAKVPFMIDGDVRLFESMAIDLYLATTYKPELLGKGAYARALVDQWSFWAISNLGVDALKVLYHTTFLPEDQRDPKQVEAGKAGVARYFEQLENALKGDYLVGDTFTLADLHVASVVGLAARAKLPMPPKVAAWFGRCTSRPGFKKTYAM